MEELEPRLLFSADSIAGMLDHQDATFQPYDASLAESQLFQTEETCQSSVSQSTSYEIVFVDAAVDVYQQLLADLQGQQDSSRRFEVYVLDSERDGIEQISDILDGQQDIDAIHIISHGEAGEIQLGNSQLNLETLKTYQASIAGWSSALGAEADLLIYGCNLAASSDGVSLLNQLSGITGADAAASDDLTGSTALGGDWELEYQVGTIESELAFSAAVQQNWNNVLAAFSVDTTADTVDANLLDGVAQDASGNTSLRAAIMQANALGGAHQINLGAGTYTLSLGSSGENAAAEGDLDIAADITLTGAGADVTIIDGNALDRIFDIRSGTVTITDVTIQNGSESGGGAISTQAGTILNLTDVALSGNTSSLNGGAIFNRGTLNLNRATLNANTAGSNGGAVYFSTGTNGSLTNVTLSGNTASLGGGLYNFNSTVTVLNSTIAYNSSGIGTSGSHTTDLKNTILTENNNANADAVLTSSGFNIDSDGTAGLSGPGDTSGTVGSPINVKLGALQYNGGTLETHLLLDGSPAIDTGDASGAPAVDQRGYARPVDGDGNAATAYDIGAVEVTPDILVNAADSNSQETSSEIRGSHQAIAMASDGSYIVVWSSQNQDGNGWGVFARQYNQDGTPKNPEFQVNSTFSGDQHWASVGVDGSGRFVIVWTSNGQDGSGDGVYLKRFNADGSEIDTSDVLVNTVSTTGDQLNPSIAVNASGQMVVAWQDNATSSIYAKQFDMTSTATGNQVPTARITVDTGPNSANPSVDINTAGKFVVVWQKDTEPYAQRYDVLGNVRGSQIDLNPLTSSTETYPVVAVQDSGDFVVAYRSEVLQGVWVKHYADNGSAYALATKVSSGSSHTAPSIAKDAAGNFIVVYEGAGDGNGTAVLGRKYDANRNSLGSAFVINQYTTNNQHMASVAMQDPDNFTVVWSGEGPGDSSGVFMRQYSAGSTLVNTAPVANAGGVYSINEGDSLTLDASASTDPDSDPLTYEWDLSYDGNTFNSDITSSTPVTTALPWASLQAVGIVDDGVYTVAVRASDGKGGTSIAQSTLTINNTAPTLTITGAATVADGGLYTLNLSASDPGSDIINKWVINWGDGTIETFTSNPASVTHTYNGGGFTYNILASATDEEGTYLQNELLVTDFGSNSLYRYQQTTGAFLQQFATGNGLNDPIQPVIGPDGMLYIGGEKSHSVLRYNPQTGVFIDAFVPAGSGGLNGADGLAFGPDGNLYVASYNTNQVLRYNGTTGAFIDVFVTAGDGGLDQPYSLVFGPDGNLYVNSYNGAEVLKFNGNTGAFIAPFVSSGSGGLNKPEQMLFGPNGDLFISSFNSNNILRFNGSTGASMGEFVAAGAGGLNKPSGLAFGPDGNLYVSDNRDGAILRFNGSTGVYIDDYVSTAGNGGLMGPSFIVFLPGQQVTVNAVNNPPTVSNLSAGEVYRQDTPLDLTDIIVADVDSTSVSVTLSLSDAGAGTLSTGTSGTVTSTFAGGTWTASGAISDVNALLAGVVFTPTTGYTSNFTLSTSVSDGVAPAVTGVKNIALQYDDALWVVTVADVNAGAPELPAWQDGQIIQLSDPGLTFGSTSDGTWSLAADFEVHSPFGLDLDAIHYVNKAMTLGGGAFPAINLLPGDVIFVTNGNETLTNPGPDVSVTSSDVVLFRPTAADYSTGTFTLLLDNPVAAAIDSITLVETDTQVGSLANGTSLSAGTFLFSYTLGTVREDIFAFTVDDVGAGSTAIRALDGTPGVASLLLDGSDFGLTQDVTGLELIENDVSVGGINLVAGDLLVSTYLDDTGVGVGTPVNPDRWDVFSLRATTTGANSSASASLVLNGADVHLSDPTESIEGLTLRGFTGSDLSASNLSTAEVYTEDTALDLTNIVVSTTSGADVTATLTLSDTAAGSLSTATSGTVTSTFVAGVWTASGALSDVNALLAGVTFTPAPNYNAGFSIATSVSELSYTAITGLKSFSSIAVNDAPTGADTTVTTLEDTDYVFSVTDFVLTDASDSPANTLSAVQVASLPGFGTLYVDVNGDGIVDAGEAVASTDTIAVADITAGRLKFKPVADQNGTGYTSFTFQVQDNGGTANAGIDLDPSPKTMTINVTAINDAPVTANVNASGNEDATSIAITLTGSDIDGTVDNFQLNGLPANGTLFTDAGLTSAALTGVDYAASGQALTLYFVPNTNWNGTTSFQYVARDNAGLLATTPATATLTVNAVNDAPTSSGIGNIIVDEDAPDTFIDLFAAFSDAEDADPALSYTLVNNTNPGLFSTTTIDTAAGTLRLGYRADQNGAADLTLRATDTAGQFVETTFNVTVNPVNDAPTAANLSSNSLQGNIDSSGGLDVGSLSASDVDQGDTASFSIVGGADAAKFSITGANNNLLTIDDDVLSEGHQASYEVIVRVTDSGGLSHDETLTITVIDLTETLLSAGTSSGQQAAQSSEAGETPATVAAEESPAVPGQADEATDEVLDLETPETVLGGGNVAPPVDIDAEAAAQMVQNPTADKAEKADLATEAVSKTEKFVNSLLDKLEGPKLNTHFEAVRMVMKAFNASAGSSEFQEQLDELREQTQDTELLEQKIVGSSMVLTTGLSVGYIVWLVRGGVLLSSVLSSLPAWRLIDPLPILATLNGRGGKADEDNESLESLVRDGNKKARARQAADARAESQLNSASDKETE